MNGMKRCLGVTVNGLAKTLFAFRNELSTQIRILKGEDPYDAPFSYQRDNSDA